MKRFILALLWTASLSGFGQGVPSPGEIARGTPSPPPPPVSTPTTSNKPVKTTPAATNPAAVDRLAQTNQELLELLKKQQAVLEDIQYDRRLQNRQIQLVEARLEESLQQNAELQAKIARLEAAAAAPVSSSGEATNTPTPVAKAPEAPPPPPATYLPVPEAQAPLGVITWRRLFTLSGEDSKTSDVFHIQGKHWRVFWHNQDRPGDTYKNTSALFISAFPKGDNIPKKICSKLGSGGDSTDVVGGGDYYLKIEASGGHWELAVEDFH